MLQYVSEFPSFLRVNDTLLDVYTTLCLFIPEIIHLNALIFFIYIHRTGTTGSKHIIILRLCECGCLSNHFLKHDTIVLSGAVLWAGRNTSENLVWNTYVTLSTPRLNLSKQRLYFLPKVFGIPWLLDHQESLQIRKQTFSANNSFNVQV